ncbi:hypothetical protein [Kitasatospora xanthocidica]|uniref:hypothetical protein n=1 Tax=Kitasatospora xanthocidica TaxID=83382 RepID=UPI001E3B1034|nr:hypothetical protein [Kitasatospora xanthocidica]
MLEHPGARQQELTLPMRVHRSAHVRNFTVLPNAVLQYRRLSYTARGLLADLLSRPDGWREDGRHMADSSPQGRGAIRKALKELTEAGYYRVEKIRMPDGTIITETHVYDTPHLTGPPGTTRPAPGEAATGRAGSPVVKNRHQEPSLPTSPADESDREGEEEAPEIREAAATLFRVIRPEPRLRLGEAEARELAPLVAQWLQRGAAHADLAHALLPGLPTPVHSAAAVLRYRLERKMPPAGPAARPPARYAECAKCHDPVPRPGICRPCAGLTTRTPTARKGADVATAGAERVRTALRSAIAGSRPAHIAA